MSKRLDLWYKMSFFGNKCMDIKYEMNWKINYQSPNSIFISFYFSFKESLEILSSRMENYLKFLRVNCTNCEQKICQLKYLSLQSDGQHFDWNMFHFFEMIIYRKNGLSYNNLVQIRRSIKSWWWTFRIKTTDVFRSNSNKLCIELKQAHSQVNHLNLNVWNS